MEIELDYDFFSEHLEKEINRLYEMFVQKNDIFPPNPEVSEGGEKITTADILLYQSIKKTSRVRQIPKVTG